MKRVLVLLVALQAGVAGAAVVEKKVEYTVGDATMESTLVYDDAVKTKRPGLVLVPNWRGATPAAVEKAKAIAGDRYVILVADVFGKGVRPPDDKAAGVQVTKMYKDLPTLRARGNAAFAQLESLAKDAPIAPDALGALGFCFGGGTVLEMARSGTPLKAVVTFHGELESSQPVKAGDKFVPAVLALNGADDTYTSNDAIVNFGKEMTAVGADWQFHNFSGAVHCFSEPDQNNPPGCVYNKRAADRAYEMMRDFFREQFGTAKQ